MPEEGDVGVIHVSREVDVEIFPSPSHPAKICWAQVMSQDGAAGHLQHGIHRVLGDLIRVTRASPCPGAKSEFPHPCSGISLPKAVAQTDRQTRMVLCQIERFQFQAFNGWKASALEGKVNSFLL